MSSKTKSYPMWLFVIEVSIILVIHLVIIGSFYKYYFYTGLWGYHVLIYMFLMITTVTLLFFLFTLITGVYYTSKKEIYNSYIKKIRGVKKKGRYCSPLKYKIGLILGFGFFTAILSLSINTVFQTRDALSILIILVAILALIGFIKSVRSGLFYRFLSTKRNRKRRHNKENIVEVTPIES